MTRNNTLNIIFLIIAIAIGGCSTSTEKSVNTIVENENLIKITQDQIDANKMEIGEPSIQKFEETISCNAYIKAPSKGMALVSTQISGIVENINFSVGDYVKKGAKLCSISSNDFIILQQEFIETSVLTKKLKADYKRNKTLVDENIGAKKNLVAIESEFKVMQAKYQSLKIRLELLGLDISKIQSGELYSSFPLVAPINGFITNRNLVLGEFISPQVKLFEIVDVDKLQLELSVFENDIQKLKEGQNIYFNSMGEKHLYSATLTSVGKSIDMDSKTIKCIASINNSKEVNFVNNTFIEAKIAINSIQANALPSQAIQKSEDDYYVFVVEKNENKVYFLRKVNIKIGHISNGFTEIIDANNLTKVLISGAYNLQME